MARETQAILRMFYLSNTDSDIKVMIFVALNKVKSTNFIERFII